MPVKHIERISSHDRASIYLLVAAVINLLATMVYSRPPDATTLVFETFGATLATAAPAWLGRLWIGVGPPAHGFTLGLALFLAFGRAYAERSR